MKNLAEQVLDYFDRNYDSLGEKRFHFASRMWLWRGREIDRLRLEKLRPEYLESLERIWQGQTGDGKESHAVGREIRRKFLEQYPWIKKTNRLLFRVLFGQTVYGTDLREEVDRLVGKEQIRRWRQILIADKEAIKALSTVAVNFLYTSAFYFNEDVAIPPEDLLQLAKEIDETRSTEWLRLKLYLLTHAIIGASVFYSRRIEIGRESYIKMFGALEKSIGANYYQVNLDNKMEFLVCGWLVGGETKLRQRIMEEAENSVSDQGSFLVDRLNVWAGKTGDSLVKSEHRNTLYLMAVRRPKW